jgi:translation initiation factor IF-3
MPLSQALHIARERDIDLVEVAPTASPSVCRLLDYGKFKYEQAKKERQAHKSKRTIEMSQIRLRPRISAHDMESKTKVARKLLEKGNKVKVFVMFRGREIVHPQLGEELLQSVAKALENTARVERPLLMEGRNMSIILSPSVKKAKGEKVDAKA